MREKPAHLGPHYAAQFGDPSVVAAYRHRPPYPDDAIEELLDLRLRGLDRVLDVGCGRGDLSIPLALRGAVVDAVDPSAAMVASGRARRGGNAPGLRWIVAPIETAELAPPYELAVAGESLHWTQWDVALPRIAAALAPRARLAIVERTTAAPRWDAELRRLIAAHSTNRDFAPYDVVGELTARGLFHEQGRTDTKPRVHHQSPADYVESFHSRNGFSRDRMPAESAQAFDDALRALLRRHVGAGPVQITTSVRIVWGVPAAAG